jgi:DNA polymerase-4
MNQVMPKILLVDMNSFFASVEQQANPFLRGKPLGISNGRTEGACLIGTSKEAKALGIKNGTPLYRARKICPNILTINSEPDKYREVSRQINKIFRDYTNQVEPYSVDESFLYFQDSELKLLAIGSEIKKRIQAEVGEWLTCSVGIAPNKFMAKLAADMQKPDGLSIIWKSQLSEVYKHKKLTDLWGLNRGWQKRLAKLNITSPVQLLDYPVQKLISVFGKPGYFIWQRVNGLEIDELRITDYELEESAIRNSQFDNPKSFGHSWVLNFRTKDKDQLKIVILRLAEKAARRMRREGFVAFGMYLSITLADGNYFRRSKKLNFSIETGLQLYQEALKLWKLWNFQENVMHIAVGFTYLSWKTTQLVLFEDKFTNLNPVLDAINNKYGEFTIRSGLLTQTSDFAPDAIAFGR